MKLTAKQSDGSAVDFELRDITNIFPDDDTVYILGVPYRLSSVECKDAAAVAAEREEHDKTAQALDELVNMIDSMIEAEHISRIYSNDARRINKAKARLTEIRARQKP